MRTFKRFVFYEIFIYLQWCPHKSFSIFLRHLFLRGLPHLCKRRRRLTASSSSRSDLVSSIEPDFYSMSKISPLPPIGSGMTNEAGDSSNNPSNSKGKLFPEELAIEKRKSATTDAEATATDGEDATETNNKINAGTTNGYKLGFNEKTI